MRLLGFLLLLGSMAFGQSKQLGSFPNDASGGPSPVVSFQGKAYFSAYTAANGRELWASDGQSCWLVQDIHLGNNSALNGFFANSAVVHNNELFFLADDGVNGFEVWHTDGSIGGAQLLKNISAGTASSSFSEAQSIGSELFFIGGNGSSLWKTDGTTQGTVFIQSFQIIRHLTVFNGSLYFSAGNNNEGEELWRHNPATGNTQMVKDLNGGFGASLPINFTPLSNTLLFMANTQSGWELWRTNGTNASTYMVKDINPGGANGVLTSYQSITVARIGDEIFFRATDGQTGFQLWRSDGTDTGTYRISSFNQSVDPGMGLPVINGQVHYSNYETPYYWSYDPVTQVNQASHFPSFYYFIHPHNWRVVNNQLIYVEADSVYGMELHLADGSAGGEFLLDETDMSNNWSSSSAPGFNRLLGAVGDEVFFSNRRTHTNDQQALWVFDLSSMNSCHPPSVLESVQLDDSTSHLMWSQVELADAYELRWREVGGGAWQSTSSQRTYAVLNNLSPQTNYVAQVRSECAGLWSDWSASETFNTSDVGLLYYTHMVAEKVESATVMRLYWRRSGNIQNVQFRYRPVGTSNWMMTASTNGYRRLSNLIPSTFYEYQVRQDINGTGWGAWTNSGHYFYTADQNFSVGEEYRTSSVYAYPNPASDWLWLEGYKTSTVECIALNGSRWTKAILSGGRVDVSDLPSGLYAVILGEQVIKVLIE